MTNPLSANDKILIILLVMFLANRRMKLSKRFMVIVHRVETVSDKRGHTVTTRQHLIRELAMALNSKSYGIGTELIC